MSDQTPTDPAPGAPPTSPRGLNVLRQWLIPAFFGALSCWLVTLTPGDTAFLLAAGLLTATLFVEEVLWRMSEMPGTAERRMLQRALVYTGAAVLTYGSLWLLIRLLAR